MDYCLKKKWGFLTVIEVIGFPNLTNFTISRLIEEHNAQLALINRLEQPIKPNEQWTASQANIFCKSYITIANLPTSKEDFFRQLGKRHRKNLPQNWRRLKHDLGNTIEFHCQNMSEIKFEEVIHLECLNRERRLKKGKSVDSLRDIQKRQADRWELTKAFGFMVTLRHKGKIIGGTLNYLYNNEAFMIVTAFDPAFEHFNIGKLGIWKTLELLIDRGFRHCNFLWGRYFFKTQFLGVEYPWTVHIVSRYTWISKIWKFELIFDGFYSRLKRFVKTRIGFN